MKKIFLLFPALFIFCASSFAQTHEASKIRILSVWEGLGKPQKSNLLIIRKSKGYYADGNKIETHLVENLLKAAAAPAMKQIEPANLGITEEWLNANAEAGFKEYVGYQLSSVAPNQQQLYLSSFKDIQSIRKILPAVLLGIWTDDVPYVEVEITEADGSKTIISSDKQPTFMLPWKIEKNGQTFETYNAEISRALTALLPKKFTNRERLSGENFRYILAQSVMWRIKENWNLLEAENKDGDAFSNLKENYEILSAEINPHHGVDFGDEWEKGVSPGRNLHAILRKSDFPKRFAVALKLPFRNGKVENLEIFHDKIDAYRNLIFSVPWLKNHIENANGGIWLRFVTNRSFSEKAMKRFAADMNKIGKNELVAEIEKEQENIALISVGGGLEYYQSYWLVLPNKKVILWRYRYPLLLNWSEKDFETKECSDRISAGLKCIGAVIEPDGNIIGK
jgi:hypothetical protein